MSITQQHVTAAPEQATSLPKRRIEPLDGLRTFAIALVVLFHLNVPLFSGGFIGVNIFFALSGYLITAILLREHRTTGQISLGHFWARRVIRLYPTLLVVVVVVVCLWTAISVYSKSNVDEWTDAALALSYSGNIARWIWHRSMGPLAQTWSLAMEEQFYLIWPPILALVLARKLRRTILLTTLGFLVGGSIVAGGVLYRMPGGGATPDVYFSPVLNVAPLLSGAVLALLTQSTRVQERLAGRLGLWCTNVGMATLLVVEFSLTNGWTKQLFVVEAVLPLVGFASTLLIAGLAFRPSLISRLFSLAPLAWFGRHGSYGLYLWHVMVIALVLPLIPGPLGVMAAIVVSVAVSIGSYFVIERPLAALQNRTRTRVLLASSDEQRPALTRGPRSAHSAPELTDVGETRMLIR